MAMLLFSAYSDCHRLITFRNKIADLALNYLFHNKYVFIWKVTPVMQHWTNMDHCTVYNRTLILHKV